MDALRSERSRVLRRSGGESPVLAHVSVANGFPPETYLPWMEALSARLPFAIDAFSVLPRPLWQEPGPPEAFHSWSDGASDLCAVFHELGAPRGLLGIGHSFGALVTAMTAVREPDRFKAMVWLDPTLFPRRWLWRVRALRLVHRLGFRPKVPIVEGALRRRNRFGSRSEALEYFRGRKIFRGWQERALAAYVEWGLRETAGGWVLEWDPGWEARTFATVEPSIWDILAGLPRDLPILVLRGSESDVFVPSAARRLERMGLAVALREIPGEGHLFPQTAPEAAAAAVAEWLSSPSLAHLF